MLQGLLSKPTASCNAICREAPAHAAVHNMIVRLVRTRCQVVATFMCICMESQDTSRGKQYEKLTTQPPGLLLKSKAS